MWPFGIVGESSGPKKEKKRERSRESALGGNLAEFLRREWQQEPLLRGWRRGRAGRKAMEFNGLDKRTNIPSVWQLYCVPKGKVGT